MCNPTKLKSLIGYLCVLSIWNEGFVIKWNSSYFHLLSSWRLLLRGWISLLFIFFLKKNYRFCNQQNWTIQILCIKFAFFEKFSDSKCMFAIFISIIILIFIFFGKMQDRTYSMCLLPISIWSMYMKKQIKWQRKRRMKLGHYNFTDRTMRFKVDLI